MGQIKVLLHKQQSLKWWYRNRNLIDLNPNYQAHPETKQWSERKKEYLIDTILNGFDMPKFYFANFYLAEDTTLCIGKPYAVIDGAKRINAIFDFFKGDLAIGDDFVFTNLRGKKYNDLAMYYPKLRRKFDDYKITVMEVIYASLEDLDNLFYRLSI